MNQLVPLRTVFSKDLIVPQISGLVNQLVPLRTVFSRPHGLTNQWFDESISALRTLFRKDLMVCQISGLMNQLVPLRTVLSLVKTWFNNSVV